MGDVSIYLVRIDSGKHVARDAAELRRDAERRIARDEMRVPVLARREPRGADGVGGSAMRFNSGIGRRLVVGIPLLWLLLLFLLPFLIVFQISFSEVRLAIPPYAPFLEWLHGSPHPAAALVGTTRFLFTDPLYISAYLYSLKVAAVSTLCCLLIGYPMAYAIARAGPSVARRVLLMLIVLPFWTSFLLRVYAWIGLLKNNGVINNILMYLGVIHQPLPMLQTDFAVYIGIVYSYLPFMILPLYANLEKHDAALLEAAADLGARPLTRVPAHHPAAVGARHHRRLPAGIHPGGGRVRGARAARPHRPAHDRAGAVG